MGGGSELCVFPEQSTHCRSSPVPPEASLGGGGGAGARGRLPRMCSVPSLQPPARQLPPVSARSPLPAPELLRHNLLDFSAASSPQPPAQSEGGVERAGGGGGLLHSCPEWKSE